MGAAVWPAETPSPTLLRRVNKAFELWRDERVDLIVPSGGMGMHPPSEAELMRRLLSEKGVPDDAILLEDQSTSTRTNALFSADILRQHQVDRVTIVTDGYHRLRAKLAFQHVGVSVMTVSASRTPPKARRWLTLKQWLRELVALPVYLLRIGPGR